MRRLHALRVAALKAHTTWGCGPQLGLWALHLQAPIDPHLALLFALMIEKASIHAYWKDAKLSPLFQKGPGPGLLDPGNYRMLAVSGTLYRLYANVL